MTKAQFIIHLEAYIFKHYRTKQAAAKAWKVSGTHISLVCSGKAKPADKVLDAIGLDRSVRTIETYTKKAAI